MSEIRFDESTTDVLIDGKVLRLQGAEPEYLHRVAALLNKKITELRKLPGYSSLDPAYRELMLNLNIADEYFLAAAEADALRKDVKDRENELNTARHELVGMKLKLENALKQVDILEKRLGDIKARYGD